MTETRRKIGSSSIFLHILCRFGIEMCYFFVQMAFGKSSNVEEKNYEIM